MTGPGLRAARVAVALGFVVLLVIPKLALLRFTRSVLWCAYTPRDWMFAAAQDALAAAVIAWGLWALMRRGRRAWLALALVGVTAWLVTLMADERARELWLQPLGPGLIKYALANRAGLRSGTDLFLRHGGGFGMTLRRALVLAVGACGGLGLLALVVSERVTAPIARRRVSPVAFALVACGALAIAAPHYRYRVEDNILTHAMLSLARAPSRAPDADLARAFDQAPRPLATTMTNPRARLTDAKPFENLVLVFLESVRWDDMGWQSAAPRMPNLARMAREGLLARSRVPVPHSTKSDYAVLTGRYPYLDVEARESAPTPYSSLMRTLVAARHARPVAYSSIMLDFENLDGLLASAGIESRIETRTLAKNAGVVMPEGSSFGVPDAPLYDLSAVRVAQMPKPFVVTLLPTAAHYPYLAPGKRLDDPDDSYHAYEASIADTDQLLARFRDNYDRAGLLKNTLVVLIGDHGESFGEHGAKAHNSTVYDVEVGAPLVFWSEDGRCHVDGVLEARHIDVAPTIADLMDVTTADWNVQGQSLLRTAGATASAYLSTFFDDVQLGLVDGTTKYIFDPGEDRLSRFDLGTDPGERSPRVITDEREKQPIVARLRAFRAYQRGWTGHQTVAP